MLSGWQNFEQDDNRILYVTQDMASIGQEGCIQRIYMVKEGNSGVQQ
jgi:hypothetical protein